MSKREKESGMSEGGLQIRILGFMVLLASTFAAWVGTKRGWDEGYRKAVQDMFLKGMENATKAQGIRDRVRKYLDADPDRVFEPDEFRRN